MKEVGSCLYPNGHPNSYIPTCLVMDFIYGNLTQPWHHALPFQPLNFSSIPSKYPIMHITIKPNIL